jgi:hypothetical protein
VSSRGALSETDAAVLVQCEDSLDHLVVLFRGYGIRLIGAAAQQAFVELKDALAMGIEALAKVNKIKQAIKAATALVHLAVAVLGKKSARRCCNCQMRSSCNPAINKASGLSVK